MKRCSSSRVSPISGGNSGNKPVNRLLRTSSNSSRSKTWKLFMRKRLNLGVRPGRDDLPLIRVRSCSSVFLLYVWQHPNYCLYICRCYRPIDLPSRSTIDWVKPEFLARTTESNFFTRTGFRWRALGGDTALGPFLE